jgi:lactate permease
MTGRLMAPLAFLMAFATVFAMSRARGVRGALPAILITGGSFALTELLVSNLLGATLTAVLGGLVCLAATSAYLSSIKGRPVDREYASTAVGTHEIHPRELFLSWLPYLLLAALIIAVNLPATKPLFAGKAPGWEWMALKLRIYNPNKLYTFTWLQSPGTIMLIAGAIAFPFLGIRYGTYAQQFGRTARQMIPSFIAVACILSISEVMNLALPILDPKTKLAVAGDLAVKQISMVATMSQALVASVSAHVYPAIAPVFGTIGVFLTGSNTSANALFGNLQKLTAQGMGLSDVLMASAGSAGASAGKMISPQSIVIAATAVGLLGSEGRLMRQTIKYTVPYVIVLGLMVWGYAFVFPGAVP